MLDAGRLAMFHRSGAAAALLFACACLGGGTASGAETGGSPALAPLAFVKFCQTYPGQCRRRPGAAPAPIAWSTPVQARLEDVNDAVNAQIRPRAKSPEEGLTWRIAPTTGDCNDYAVTKRQRLIAAGYAPGNLLLAAVTTAWGEAHLVLLVRTDRGEMVLDNLSRDVRPWSRTGYRLISRQAAGESQRWVS